MRQVAGGDAEEERFILQTWTEWYLGAVDAMRDMEVGGPSAGTLARLKDARDSVAEAGRRAIEGLGTL